MLKLSSEQLNTLSIENNLVVELPVIGYDVFEYVTDGFYAGMYRVHGKLLNDCNELDDCDNIISTIKQGTYEKVCVVPNHINKYCTYTNGKDVCDIYDENEIFQFSSLVNVKLKTINNEHIWEVTIFKF